MATTQATPIPTQGLPTPGLPTAGLPTKRGALPVPAVAVEDADQTPALALPVDEAPELEPHLARLPVELDVAVPIRDFRVRNLLALQAEELIVSKWANGEDVPLSAGAVRLGWCEFEVVENQLAVRITRLE